jgi:hypothetical protein
MKTSRGERRARTRTIARRRLRAAQISGMIDEPESEGFFKKSNGFTNKTESSRQWEKTYKRKQANIKDLRRNGTIIDHLD